MGIVLDFIIVAVIGLFVYFSAKRGFIKTAIELVGFFLALYLSITLSGIISEQLYENFVKDSLVEKVETVANENVKVTTENFEEAFNTLPDIVVSLGERYGVSKEGLSEYIVNQSNTSNFAENIVDYAAKPVFVNVFKIVLYVVLFLVLSILVKWLARILNKMFNIPIIGGLNKTLGGVIGFIKGLVICCALCIGISIIVSLTKNGFLIFTQQNIDDSLIFKFLTEFNPL